MVPFSFKSERSYSRVMMRQLMVEGLELRAASVTSVTLDPTSMMVDDRHQDSIGARLARTLAPPKGQLGFVEIL